MSHNNTPAEVLRAALVAAGVGSLRSADPVGIWPIFVGHLPNTPNDALCIYDTAGIREGRINPTGESVEKPGWQIRCRATDPGIAYAKVREIRACLDGVLRSVVILGEDSYTIQAVKQTGTVIALGQEPDGNRRSTFTLNGTITFTTT